MSQNKSKTTTLWENWGKIALLIAGALVLTGITLAFTNANDIYKGSALFAILVLAAYALVIVGINFIIKKARGTSPSAKTKAVVREIPNEQLMTIIQLLGGRDNIVGVEACMTRLRVKIKDTDEVDTSNAWKENGAQGLIIKEDSVQAIFGAQTESLESALKTELNL
ncbi:MAG TPA: hypothetical protein DCY20_06665 [Firmicutes bacterium]|nr:hypothetical protein [Bacillota bacterium]